MNINSKIFHEMIMHNGIITTSKVLKSCYRNRFPYDQNVIFDGQ